MESLVIGFKWSLPEVVELAFHGIFKVNFKVSAIATCVLITRGLLVNRKSVNPVKREMLKMSKIEFAFFGIKSYCFLNITKFSMKLSYFQRLPPRGHSCSISCCWIAVIN